MNIKSIFIACLFACVVSSSVSIVAQDKKDEWLKKNSWSSLDTLQAGAAIGGTTGALSAICPVVFWPVAWYALWCMRHKIADAVVEDAVDKGEFIDKAELKYNAWVADWIAWAAACSLLYKIR